MENGKNISTVIGISGASLLKELAIGSTAIIAAIVIGKIAVELTKKYFPKDNDPQGPWEITLPE